MEAFGTEGLTFTYPSGSAPALRDISLSVEAGEFVVLCGASGCGKTTLLRLLKSSIAPNGTLGGNIRFMGKPLAHFDSRDICGQIGFVFQDADEQIVTDKVWHELAFTLESLGTEVPEMRRRIAETAEFFGISDLLDRDVSSLSGGQKQLLCLASACAAHPSALLLDEPVSMLDPIATSNFIHMLLKLNREAGTTVIVSEQRLDELLPVADRAMIMGSGRIEFDGLPAEAGKYLAAGNDPMLMSMPVPSRVFLAADGSGDCPLTVRGGREWLEKYGKKHRLEGICEKPRTPCGDILTELKGAWFRYDRGGADVLCGADIAARRGELLAIVGGNGAGKSTLLSVLCGIKKPYRGAVRSGENIEAVLLPQDVRTLFVSDTVRGDLTDMADKWQKKEEDIIRISSLCGIENLLERHPYDLSGGERQRAALAKILLSEPDVLLLDEPTRGMDAPFRKKFGQLLRKLRDGGTAVVIASHDLEFCAEFDDRCAMLFRGEIVSEGAPREFFSGSSYYTTPAAAMSRGIVDGAVTCGDIIAACGAAEPKVNDDNGGIPPNNAGIPPADGGKVSKPERKKRTPISVAVSALFLALIPLTVFAGMELGGTRKYFYISMLALLEALAAFAARFEGGKPRAREIAVIAALCALAVAGRAALFMFPQCKPVAAIVVLSGACLGGEAGFAVGALSAFVSDFMFGQGPWTPWQMLGFGLLGLLSGTLFYRAERRGRTALCIFGALSVLMIYGPLNDISGVLMYQSEPNIAMVMTAIGTGLPFNMAHAAATAFFIWLLAKPMTQKLMRLRTKYGLLE